MRRLAAIDIGTVTVRLLVAEVGNPGAPAITECARAVDIVHLGEGVDATGTLDPHAIKRTIAVLVRYVRTTAEWGISSQDIICFATSATRDAKNAELFQQEVCKLGLTLRVFSGETEAQYSFAGASALFPGECVLVCDVGGGSTELIVGTGAGKIDTAHSFNIGCRRVTERVFTQDPPVAADYERAREWCATSFVSFFESLTYKPKRMVAVAGTATTAVAVQEHLAVYDPSRVHGYELSLQMLKDIRERLGSVSNDERVHTPGLQAGRAPVIVAGLVIMEEVMKAAGMNTCTVSEHDILHGVIYASR